MSLINFSLSNHRALTLEVPSLIVMSLIYLHLIPASDDCSQCFVFVPVTGFTLWGAIISVGAVCTFYTALVSTLYTLNS